MSKYDPFGYGYSYGYNYSFGYSSSSKIKPITYAISSATHNAITQQTINTTSYANHYNSIDLEELLETNLVKAYSKCIFCENKTKIILKDYNPYYTSSAYSYSYQAPSSDKFISFECQECNYYAISDVLYTNLELGKVVFPTYLSTIQLVLDDGSFLCWLHSGDCYHTSNGKSNKVNIELSNDKQKILDKLNILLSFR